MPKKQFVWAFANDQHSMSLNVLLTMLLNDTSFKKYINYKTFLTLMHASKFAI
jgi:hypothetical protein